MLRTHHFIVLFGLVALLGTTGCKRTIDGAKLEKHIKEEVEKQTKDKPKSVNCPHGTVEKKDATFDCTVVTSEGVSIKAKVTMQGGGSVKWVLGLNPKKIEANIAERVEQKTQVKPKSVSCPKEMEDAPGGKIECKVVLQDGSDFNVLIKTTGDGKAPMLEVAPKKDKPEKGTE